MPRLPITLGQYGLVVCCLVCGCSVDLAKLRAPAQDGGADSRLLDDAYRDSAVGDGDGPRLGQDSQPADRWLLGPEDGRSDVLVGPRTDSSSEDTRETGGAVGTDADSGGGPPEPADAGVDIAGGGADSPSQSRDDAALTDLASDAPESSDTSVGTVDGSVDMREAPDLPSGSGDLTDAPVDGAQNRDVGSDLPLGTLACPTTINGSLDSSDPVQIGRHSRIAPTSACGMTKQFPSTGADSAYSHLYDLYRFHNPSDASACFNFTLTYPGAQLYAAAYTHFVPTDITSGYLGDVGATLDSPQSMGITVAGGTTIEVVVYAIAMGTASAGSYTLSCSSQ